MMLYKCNKCNCEWTTDNKVPYCASCYSSEVEALRAERDEVIEARDQIIALKEELVESIESNVELEERAEKAEAELKRWKDCEYESQVAALRAERDAYKFQLISGTPSSELLRRTLEAEEGKKHYMALVSQAQEGQTVAESKLDEVTRSRDEWEQDAAVRADNCINLRFLLRKAEARTKELEANLSGRTLIGRCGKCESAEAELAASEAECLEQARLNGMGGEREAALISRLSESEARVKVAGELYAALDAHLSGGGRAVALAAKLAATEKERDEWKERLSVDNGMLQEFEDRAEKFEAELAAIREVIPIDFLPNRTTKEAVREMTAAGRRVGTELAACREDLKRKDEALRAIHDNTKDYIERNDLGDPYRNQDMRLVRDALSSNPQAVSHICNDGVCRVCGMTVLQAGEDI